MGPFAPVLEWLRQIGASVVFFAIWTTCAITLWAPAEWMFPEVVAFRAEHRVFFWLTWLGALILWLSVVVGGWIHLRLTWRSEQRAREKRREREGPYF